MFAASHFPLCSRLVVVMVEAVFIKSGGCEGDEEMILCSHQSHQGPVITCLAWKQGHSAADSHQ